MSDSQNNGVIVGTKRVRTGVDTKGRQKTVLTFGLDKEGNNTADVLIEALEALRGKQINFDVRVEEKQGSTGSFQTAFVIVKEMIPKDQAQAKARFVPKNQARANTVKATAQKIREQMED